jgi:glycosyltransferase involved in cell wall biosynthesis
MNQRAERVVGFLSSGLGSGGSEHNLLKLLGTLTDTVKTGLVASLSNEVALVPEIVRRRTPVFALGISRVVQLLPGVRRLLKLFGRFRIDLLQTWMPHADLVGGLLGRFILRKPVVWNIRQTFAAEDRLNPRLTAIVHLCARLSRLLPAAIVCCSESARQACLELGYAPEKLLVIHNGYDAARFAWNRAARAARRGEWGCRDDDFVIGVVGRWHPKKDYETLFQALKLVCLQRALVTRAKKTLPPETNAGEPRKALVRNNRSNSHEKTVIRAHKSNNQCHGYGLTTAKGFTQQAMDGQCDGAPPRLKVILVGTGLTPENSELMSRLRALGPAEVVVPVGPHKKIETVYSGFDLFVLPSASEGFPNVLAEAMACECPVVSTRVGEAELIVGECGTLVPPRDPENLAQAIEGYLRLSPEQRRELGRKCRARIERLFPVAAMRQAYADLYERILDEVRGL